MFTPSRAFLAAVLERAAGTSTVTVMGSASIGLIRSPFAPTVDTTYAQVVAVEANYTGYARQAAGLDTPSFIGPGNLSLLEGDLLVFMSSDTVTPNTIYGHFWTGSATSTFYGCEMYDNPIPLPTPAERVTIVPRVGLDPNANYGLSLVSN